MTKISDNGQLEWTFEGLDFEGAFSDLFSKIRFLISERNLLMDKRSKLRHYDVDYDYYKNLYTDNVNYLSDRIDHYFLILGYLEALSKGGRF